MFFMRWEMIDVFEHRVVLQESWPNLLIPASITSTNELVTVWDPEVGKINPSKHKQLKLARSLNRGIIDRDLKPSSTERKGFPVWLRDIPGILFPKDNEPYLPFKISKGLQRKFANCHLSSPLVFFNAAIDFLSRVFGAG